MDDRSPPPPALPNPGPRPPDELAELERIWVRPRGIQWLGAVNNNIIGVLYVGTALLFFVLAGCLALLMRAQLAQPGASIVGHELYNQLFTMHGTIMMFLFAVPAVEAMGVLLLPGMLAARDLPFPRLSAYAYWAYAVGGLAFFASLFFGLAPSSGWFMYPPLSSTQYSPGINADFWLLGIGFIEISAIAGAIEIIVGILKTRSPGMTLDKLPLFAWAMLIFAFMIVFAFPAVIVATFLLELERAFDWPIFIAERGGDPVLWQHLFWFFGHPEVYIIFLPAAGMVSMMIATLARVPLVGYRLVVLAIIATGFLSFGLWVHHMFATGLPSLSLSFFSAASMAVAIPTGVQIFAWSATLAAGRARLNAYGHFLLGFFFIFVLGGLTGVMIAMVPFDWQVHDTYFIVAHLHYVLIGGMVFPLFGAFYYWAPAFSTRPLSERLGKISFWLMFAGTNVTFFPMHFSGLIGMPRRVYTYLPGLGLDTLNLISTIGAVTIALGVLVFLIDLALNFRPFGESHGNPWDAGTLEWLPTGNYQTRSIPHVTSREPLWDQPNLAREVTEGRHYLPGSVTGTRETIVTGPIEAQPQYVLQLPGPGLSPFLSALFTAAFFMLLTIKFYAVAVVCGVLAVALVIVWLWQSDPGPAPAVDVGAGFVIPINATGSVNHAWWATLILAIVMGVAFVCLVFSYLFLWLVSEGAWIASAGTPHALWPLAALILLVGCHLLLRGAQRTWGLGRAVPAALVTLGGVAVAAAGATLVWAQIAAGIDPRASGYGAIVYAILAFQCFVSAVVVLMCLFTSARILFGLASPERCSTFDNTALFARAVVLQGALTVVLLHGFPMLIGGGR